MNKKPSFLSLCMRLYVFLFLWATLLFTIFGVKGEVCPKSYSAVEVVFPARPLGCNIGNLLEKQL
jgi:hypothetical protein